MLLKCSTKLDLEKRKPARSAVTGASKFINRNSVVEFQFFKVNLDHFYIVDFHSALTFPDIDL